MDIGEESTIEKESAVRETSVMAEVNVVGCGSRAEDGASGFEIPRSGAIITSETLESDTPKIETPESTSPISPESTRNTEPSPDEPTESVDLVGPDVLLDCTQLCPDFEKKDLDTETRLESESCDLKADPLHSRPEVYSQIETEAGINTINASLDLKESSVPDVSSGCSFASSVPEVESTDAFSNEPRTNAEEVDEAEKVRFEPGVICSDVSRAVEILKTSYRLSDVTIRKNMITWSCWNIADMIRGPHKDTTWWKGGSLPRRTDAKQDELQDVIAEELKDDEEFHLEMTELCRKIDTKDWELGQILDDILQVAQQNKNDPYKQQTDAIEVVETQMLHKKPATNQHTQSISGQEQQTVQGNEEKSTKNDALRKQRNPFVRVMRAIRRRFSRRHQTRKHD